MNRVMLSVALALGLGLTQAHAQTEQAENPKKQGVVGKIMNDLRESTRTVHEISKENLAAEKVAFKKRHTEAVELDADFVNFRQAKGLKNKMAVVAESFRENNREVSEKEKERREQIKSHDPYRTLLEEQRAKRETLMSNGYKG